MFNLNEDILKGKWSEIKGDLQAKFGELTESDLDQNSGNLKSIAGLLQQKYGLKKEEVDQKIDQLIEKYAGGFSEKISSFKNSLKSDVKSDESNLH